MCVCMCVWVYVCMCVCVYVCMGVWVYGYMGVCVYGAVRRAERAMFSRLGISIRQHWSRNERSL